MAVKKLGGPPYVTGTLGIKVPSEAPFLWMWVENGDLSLEEDEDRVLLKLSDGADFRFDSRFVGISHYNIEDFHTIELGITGGGKILLSVHEEDLGLLISSVIDRSANKKQLLDRVLQKVG